MGVTKEWRLSISKPHTVRFQHSFHSGRAKLTVDGTTVYETENEAHWDTGFEYDFTVDEVQCRICIDFVQHPPGYELLVNGEVQSLWDLGRGDQ